MTSEPEVRSRCGSAARIVLTVPVKTVSIVASKSSGLVSVNGPKAEEAALELDRVDERELPRPRAAATLLEVPGREGRREEEVVHRHGALAARAVVVARAEGRHRFYRARRG